MLMIGVMPLPALMNSSFSGSGSGSTKSPSTPPSETIAPGRPWRDQVRGDDAGLDELRGDRDAAVGPVGLGGQRVGAPVAHAADVDSDPAGTGRRGGPPSGTRA